LEEILIEPTETLGEFIERWVRERPTPVVGSVKNDVSIYVGQNKKRLMSLLSASVIEKDLERTLYLGSSLILGGVCKETLGRKFLMLAGKAPCLDIDTLENVFSLYQQEKTGKNLLLMLASICLRGEHPHKHYYHEALKDTTHSAVSSTLIARWLIEGGMEDFPNFMRSRYEFLVWSGSIRMYALYIKDLLSQKALSERLKNLIGKINLIAKDLEDCQDPSLVNILVFLSYYGEHSGNTLQTVTELCSQKIEGVKTRVKRDLCNRLLEF